MKFAEWRSPIAEATRLAKRGLSILLRNTRRRRDQLALVELLTDDAEPGPALRKLAEKYKADVAAGRITSSR
ncbi:MAG: hypothetical protein HC923_03665 [Myxococcales bacterium]|nr:hypothetical protein [Myxococcales bacterium]